MAVVCMSIVRSTLRSALSTTFYTPPPGSSSPFPNAPKRYHSQPPSTAHVRPMKRREGWSAQFAPDDSGVTLTMGDTRVMTVVSAALEPPFLDRPNEGSLRINVELSPMASPDFEAGRPGARAAGRWPVLVTASAEHIV